MSDSSPVAINHAVIIGVGLIGGSVARCLRARSGVSRITGVGRSVANLDEAVKLGIIDSYTNDVPTAVADADLIVVATPVLQMGPVMEAIASSAPAHVVITDVGSVKAEIVRLAGETLGPLKSRFVAAHPISGTEHSGAGASFEALFENRALIMTPTSDTDADALATVDKVWRETGADVVSMDVENHDKILAATSHMPHILAYTLVEHMARQPGSDQHFELAAGGFYDFTRIASSDPMMWRDVCLTNKQAMLKSLNSFVFDLNSTIDAISREDGDALYDLFTRAKVARDRALYRRRQD